MIPKHSFLYNLPLWTESIGPYGDTEPFLGRRNLNAYNVKHGLKMYSVTADIGVCGVYQPFLLFVIDSQVRFNWRIVRPAPYLHNMKKSLIGI